MLQRLRGDLNAWCLAVPYTPQPDPSLVISVSLNADNMSHVATRHSFEIILYNFLFLVLSPPNVTIFIDKCLIIYSLALLVQPPPFGRPPFPAHHSSHQTAAALPPSTRAGVPWPFFAAQRQPFSNPQVALFDRVIIHTYKSDQILPNTFHSFLLPFFERLIIMDS